MLYFVKWGTWFRQERIDQLRFIGMGIRHPRNGAEQIIPNRSDGHPHYSLVFNHDELPITVEGESRTLPANTLVVWDWKPRVIYGRAGMNWRLSWLQFGGSQIEELIQRHRVPLNTPFPFDGERIINTYYVPVYEEFHKYIRMDEKIICNHIEGVFLEVVRAIRSEAKQEKHIPENFRQICRFIESNYGDELTLSSLAKRIHLAPAYFSRKFKEYFGRGPIDYLVMFRLHIAMLNLHNPELSIQEIAARIGYRDSFYFSKLFKRRFGMAPQTFRTQL